LLKLDHKKDLPEAFNIGRKERDMLIDLVKQLAETKGDASVTWTIERLWIDERFSDNLRAMSIFLLGYAKCLQDMRGGETEWKKSF
jgi:hypothetical protein